MYPAGELAVLRQLLFYHEIVCCVYSLEMPHWGNSYEYTQHTIIMKEIKKNP